MPGFGSPLFGQFRVYAKEIAMKVIFFFAGGDSREEEITPEQWEQLQFCWMEMEQVIAMHLPGIYEGWVEDNEGTEFVKNEESGNDRIAPSRAGRGSPA